MVSRRRRSRDESNTERWVVSYADFITLLLAFFVVMYSISSINEAKFRALSETFEGVFRGPNYTFDPVSVGDVKGRDNHRQVGMLEEHPESAGANAPLPVVDDEAQELKNIHFDLSREFKDLIDSGELKVNASELWLEIEIRSSVIFPSGSAEPSIESDAILETIAEILKPTNNPINVEGFTDNEPIQSSVFPSNWELSAARAAGVVRALSFFGVAPERMAAVGYGEYQPKVSNLSESGRSINRRVKIVVSRDEKMRRALTAYGSDNMSKDAVQAILEEKAEKAPEDDADVIQVETDQGVIFKRGEATPNDSATAPDAR